MLNSITAIPVFLISIIHFNLKKWNQQNMVVPTIFLFHREPAVTIVLIMSTGRIYNPFHSYFTLKNWMAKTIVYPNGEYLPGHMLLQRHPPGQHNDGNIGDD